MSTTLHECHTSMAPERPADWPCNAPGHMTDPCCIGCLRRRDVSPMDLQQDAQHQETHDGPR